LPNHYHLFLKVKTDNEVKTAYQSVYPFKQKELTYEEMPAFVLQQISNFQNSYSKSFNKVFGRKGRLFLESVKRREVVTEDHYSKIIHYVHANAVHHGICKRIEDWPHSSYHALISTAPTLLKRNELLDWFGGLEAFIQFHQQTVELKLKEED
jgi:REP element-mobilizing transposase RayT